jgi:hypothetical protein
MRRARMQAVCGSCRWREVCPDAPILEQLGKAIESSRLAGEFPLRIARRYRLGCDRYRYAGKDSVEVEPTPLRLIVANDGDAPVA